MVIIQCRGNEMTSHDEFDEIREEVTSRAAQERFPRVNWTVTELSSDNVDEEVSRYEDSNEEVATREHADSKHEADELFAADFSREKALAASEQVPPTFNSVSETFLPPHSAPEALQFFDNGVTDDVIDTINYTSNFQTYQQVPVVADVSDVTTFLERLLSEEHDSGRLHPIRNFPPLPEQDPVLSQISVDFPAHLHTFPLNERENINNEDALPDQEYVDQGSVLSPEEEFLQALEQQRFGADESLAETEQLSSDSAITALVAPRDANNRIEMTSSRARAVPRFPSVSRRHRTRGRGRYRSASDEELMSAEDSARRIDRHRTNFEDFSHRQRRVRPELARDRPSERVVYQQDQTDATQRQPPNRGQHRTPWWWKLTASQPTTTTSEKPEVELAPAQNALPDADVKRGANVDTQRVRNALRERNSQQKVKSRKATGDTQNDVIATDPNSSGQQVFAEKQQQSATGTRRATCFLSMR